MNKFRQDLFVKFQNLNDISIEETMQLFDRFDKKSDEKTVKTTIFKLQLGEELKFSKET